MFKVLIALGLLNAHGLCASLPTFLVGSANSQKITGSDYIETWSLPTQGYSLSSISVWKQSQANIVGILLTFTPDAGGAPVTHMYGNTVSATETALAITKKIESIKSCDDKPQTGFIFTFEDTTTTETVSIIPRNASNDVIMCQPGNFIGFSCSWHVGGGFDPQFLNGCATWYDKATPYIFTSSISNQVYTVTQTAATLQFKTGGLHCHTETFTIVYKKNGVVISNPSWLTFTAATKSFSISTSLEADVSDVTVDLTATSSTINSATSAFWTVTMPTFTITVRSQCYLTTITARSLNAITVNVAQTAATQDITFQDAVGTLKSNVAFCGLRTYTFSPSLTYLSLSGTTLNLFTNSVSDVGSQTVTVTVQLASYPSIPAVTASLAVSVTCQVQTLTFSTAIPSTTTIEIGITAQPYLIHFGTTKVPNCAQNPSFTLSPNTDSFQSLINISSGAGDYRVQGATLANKGTYNYSIAAAVDSQMATSNFQIILKDPCQTAVFQTTPAPLINMSVNMPSTATTTQAVTILTDVQVSYPTIVCSITATLSPAKAYITLSGNFATISVNASLIAVSDYGTNSFTLTVNSTNFSGTVIQQTYSFDVIIACQVSSLTITSQAADTTYTLNQGLLNTLPFLVTQANACLFPYTYTHTFEKSGLPIAQPAWINFDAATQKFSITITAPIDIGVYMITSTATIPQDDGTGVNRSKSYSFILTVQSDCVNTSITDKIINAMSTKVSQTAATQDISFADLIGTNHANQTYCGTKTYTISPSLSFLTLSGTILTLSTTNVADVNVYNVVLTVSLSSYPGVVPIAKNIQLTITCEVLTLAFTTLIPASTIIQVGITANPFNMAFTTSQVPNCGNAVNFVFGSSYAFMSLQSLTSFAGVVQILNPSAVDGGTHTQTLTASANAQSTPINFQVTLDFCSSTVFQTTPAPLSNMNVSLPNVATLTQTVTIKTDVEIANPSIICPITATLVPLAAYISLSADFKTISVNEALATTPTDLGTKSFTLTVKSANFAGTVAQQIYNFDVIFSCVVTSLTFSTIIPSTQTIQVGITSQPYMIPFQTTQSPACNKQISFTLAQTNPATPYTHVSLSGVASFAGNVQVTGAVIAEHNTYSYKLTAAIAEDFQNFDSFFDVFIKDPCSTAVFQTSPAPIVNMNVSLPSTATQNQTVTIETDVQITHSSIVCPVTATLTPAAAYISLSADFKTISVNEALATTPTDLGAKSFTLTVNSANFSGAVAQKTYSFDVIIACQVSSLTIISQAADTTYTLNQGLLNTLPFYVTQTNACLFPYTYTHTFKKAGVAIAQPAWISFDSTTQKFCITIIARADIGVYTITSTATIPQDDGTGVNRSKSYSFTLTVQSDCVNTSITDKIINAMSTKVSQTAATQDISFADLIGTAHGDPNYCGAKIYTISPSLSFLTLSETTLTLSTTNVADVCNKTITVTVALAEFGLIPVLTKTFTVQVICEVISIIENQIPNDVYFTIFKDQPIVQAFLFTEFPQCGLTYSLTNPQTFIQLDSNLKKITVDTTFKSDKGIYFTQLQVKPLTQGLNKTFDFKVTIIDFCDQTSFVQPIMFPNIETYIQRLDRAHVYQTFPTFEYIALKQYSYNCGQIQTQLLTADKGERPSWASFSSENSINYDLSKFSKPFTQRFNLTASLQDSPQVQTMVNFNVTLSTLEIQCQTNQQQTYILGSGTSAFQVGYLNKTQTVSPVNAVFESTGLNNAGQEIELPSFFSFNRQNGIFSVNTNDKDDVGVYKLGLYIYYRELPSYKIRCELPLKVKYTPIFDGDLIVDKIFDCKELAESQKIKIPEFTDFFGHKATMTLDLAGAGSFLKFDPSVGQIKMIDEDSSILSQNNGSYQIKYKLTDLLGNSLEYFFLVNVVCFQIVAKKPVQPQRPYVASSDPPRPFIKSISPIGIVRIEFTKILLIPNYDLFPEFKEPGMMRPVLNATQSNSTNITSSQLRQLEELTQQSRRYLKTQKEIEQEAIEIINRGIVVLNNTNFPVVELQLIAGNQTDPQFTNFTYVCIKFKPSYMEFQTYYSYIDEISIREAKENLKAEFYGPWYFRTSSDEAFSPDISISVDKEVPRQMDPQSGKVLAVAASIISNASKIVVVVNFLFSGALQQMLSSMKKMQIMIHLLLMDISIPSNVAVFFNAFLQLVTYNLIDLEPSTRRLFKLYDDEPLSETFNQLGYQSQFSVINLGSVFLAIIVIPPVLVIVYVFWPFQKYRYFRKLRYFLKRKFIWDGIISIFNENYILITVSCFINLTFTENLQSKGEIFSFTVACVFLTVVVGYPIFVLVILNKNYKRLGTYNWRHKIGSLYLNFKFNKGKLQVLEPFFSAMRRLLLIIAVIFLKGFPAFQLMVCTYTWAATIILNGYLMFENPRSFTMDQTNEAFIMILVYHMICFADLVTDEKTRGHIGWSMVGTMCLNILFNFGVILKDSISELVKKVRLWWWKRKNRILKLRIKNFEDNKELIKQAHLAKLKRQNEEEKKEEENEEIKIDLGLVNRNNVDEEDNENSTRMNKIRKLWEDGNNEAESPRLIEPVLKSNKSKQKNNRKRFGQKKRKARPAPNPLGMNQDDSDLDIEPPTDNGCQLHRRAQQNNLSDIIESNNEKSYSDEESKGYIQGVQVIDRVERAENYRQHIILDDPFDQFARVYQRQRMISNEIVSPSTQQARFEELWINHRFQPQPTINQLWNTSESALVVPPKKQQKINLNDL